MLSSANYAEIIGMGLEGNCMWMIASEKELKILLGGLKAWRKTWLGIYEKLCLRLNFWNRWEFDDLKKP